MCVMELVCYWLPCILWYKFFNILCISLAFKVQININLMYTLYTHTHLYIHLIMYEWTLTSVHEQRYVSSETTWPPRPPHDHLDHLGKVKPLHHHLSHRHHLNHHHPSPYTVLTIHPHTLTTHSFTTLQSIPSPRTLYHHNIPSLHITA